LLVKRVRLQAQIVAEPKMVITEQSSVNFLRFDQISICFSEIPVLAQEASYTRERIAEVRRVR
jgi:hypothetical protein